MPDGPYFNELIQALHTGSGEFRRWDGQLTAPPLATLDIGVKLPRHGVLRFTSVRFRPLESQHLLALMPRRMRSRRRRCASSPRAFKVGRRDAAHRGCLDQSTRNDALMSFAP
jgi:hypothetical protein